MEARNASELSNKDNEVLSIYLRQIERIPLLSHEQETELAVRARKGDKKARDKIISSNLRFVVSVAKKYAGQGLALEDLISEGNLGLIIAIDKFEPEKGYHFISYAVWWIRQSIMKALSEKSRTVRLPLNRANELMQIQKARTFLMHEGNTAEPAIEDIARETGLSETLIKDLLSISHEVLSFDSPRSQDSDSNSTLGDTLEDPGKGPEEQLVDSSLAEEVDSLLDILTDKEKDIIKLRYGIGYEKGLSLKEIGERYGLTKERIRQIEKKALEKLRECSVKRDLTVYSQAC